MKKLFLTLTVVCAFALASFGQGASFGVKAGINIANQNGQQKALAFLLTVSSAST